MTEEEETSVIQLIIIKKHVGFLNAQVCRKCYTKC